MIQSIVEPSLSISYNILRTAQFAPPWKGPQREPIPAAIQAYGLACELPAILTVEVEAFCSCSAWQIHITYRAFIISSAIQNYSSIGLENIMYKKFFIYPYFFLGKTRGNPIAVLQAQAANVGILAISFIAIQYLSLGLESQYECKKAESAPTTPTIILIGCESLLKPLQNSIIFAFIIISPTTAYQNFISSACEGKTPQRRRQQVYIQVECQASCSMGYPLQRSSPFQPSMQQMFERQLAVHINPGSYVRRLPLDMDSKERTSISFGPRLPCKMGSSYSVFPILSMAFQGSSFGCLGVTCSKS